MPASDAPHPFNQRSADVILRTSDSISFHVHTQILSQASPVFATMFELPQPSPEAPGVATLVRPVIDVSEDSKALEPLLRLCYPVKKAILRQPEDIRPVLEAAIKYDMEWPTEALTRTLMACAPHGPLQVWAIGCRLGLERVARRGAEVFAGSIPSERDQASIRRAFRFLPFANDGFASITYPAEGVPAPDIICRCVDGMEFKAHQSILSLWSPPSADITLRTSNAVDFHVHTAVLSIVSPVFATMFKLPQPQQPHREEATGTPPTRPIIEVAEDSRSLDPLLRLCYPTELLPYGINRCIDLLAAATVYKVRHVIDLAFARWKSLVDCDPLSSYFLAHRRGLAAAAAVAASGTLAISGVSMQQISVLRIMDELPAWTYHVLLEYHDACSHAVSEQLDDAKTEFAIASGFGGKTSSPREANCLYKSVSRRLNEQQEALKERTVAPKADHVAGLRNLADVATDIQYHKLCPVTYNLLTRLTETLPQRIEDAIGKVSPTTLDRDNEPALTKRGRSNSTSKLLHRSLESQAVFL
ncbi:hypothetical protein DICSQDRAFT_112052 [Dichomitus squalens LYAD-421 SS1]|uniref:BTB domain-containing protein n=1 Tax=Dichomitus squalens (strain LYAD-421) TaxID=732165 RepID=R7SNF2_DICSQ|nr:uncharacterized protein DICSQDRAFT_112052 [Dichomitus squalens LYAD-421 SS1]EJF57230.1 hypothetical protein DICSQDRAFT_112052 [Dichomitus squalens LYAD-421 SS1]